MMGKKKPRQESTPQPRPSSPLGDEEETISGSREELYKLCEAAKNIEDDGDEKLEEIWDAIRSCFAELPSMQQRQFAATYRGPDNTVALHLLCQARNPPFDIINSLILYNPETVGWQDSSGWLPLHHATANKQSYTVLKRLISAFPAGACTQDVRQRTPLHFAFVDPHEEKIEEDLEEETAGKEQEQSKQLKGDTNTEEDDNLKSAINDSPVDIVELLSKNGAAEIPDINGFFPMHYACAYGNTLEVLEVLWEAFPESITSKENSGRTPLHLAMANAHRRTGPQVVEFILGHDNGEDNESTGRVVDMADDKGRLPLNILATICKRSALEDDERQNASKCLELYLDARPTASADFVSAMRETPEWLRDNALLIRYGWKEAPAPLQKKMLPFVANASPETQSICFNDDFVRAGINRLFIKRPVLAVMMCDLYCQILLVAGVSAASASRKDDGVMENWHRGVLIVGAAWFLLRELIQMISSPCKGYITDYWNWLDLAQISLVIASLAVVKSNDSVTDSGRVLLTVTVGVVWFALLGVWKNFLYGVSVFLSSLQQILVKLIPFMAVTAITVAAFAFMLHTSNKNLGSCTDAYEDEQPWYCGGVGQLFADLLAFVFSMRELEIEITTAEAIINGVLYAFGFIIALILLNVLIAKISNVFSEVEEKGDYFFWEDRVSALTDAEALLHLHEKTFGFLGRGCKKGNGSSSHTTEPQVLKQLERGLHSFDKKVESKKKVNNDATKDALTSGEEDRGDKTIMKVLRHCLVPILYVCFFLAGCVSFGILWPKWMSSAMFYGKYENFDDLKGDISNVQKNMASNVKVLEQRIDGIQNVARSNNEVVEERITRIEDALKRIEDQLGALLDKK